MNHQEVLVYIGLGSNMGNRSDYLRNGLAQIEDLDEIRVEKISSIYETEPVGYLNQEKFLNCVVQLKTSMPPLRLLAAVKEIEKKQNRRQKARWGPRTLDLDILFYGSFRMNLPELTIPHPEAHKRRFVMVPLCEISPDFKPFAGTKTISQLLNECQDRATVEHFAGAEFIR